MNFTGNIRNTVLLWIAIGTCLISVHRLFVLGKEESSSLRTKLKDSDFPSKSMKIKQPYASVRKAGEEGGLGSLPPDPTSQNPDGTQMHEDQPGTGTRVDFSDQYLMKSSTRGGLDYYATDPNAFSSSFSASSSNFEGEGGADEVGAGKMNFSAKVDRLLVEEMMLNDVGEMLNALPPELREQIEDNLSSDEGIDKKTLSISFPSVFEHIVGCSIDDVFDLDPVEQGKVISKLGLAVRNYLGLFHGFVKNSSSVPDVAKVMLLESVVAAKGMEDLFTEAAVLISQGDRNGNGESDASMQENTAGGTGIDIIHVAADGKPKPEQRSRRRRTQKDDRDEHSSGFGYGYYNHDQSENGRSFTFDDFHKSYHTHSFMTFGNMYKNLHDVVMKGEVAGIYRFMMDGRKALQETPGVARKIRQSREQRMLRRLSTKDKVCEQLAKCASMMSRIDLFLFFYSDDIQEDGSLDENLSKYKDFDGKYRRIIELANITLSEGMKDNDCNDLLQQFHRTIESGTTPVWSGGTVSQVCYSQGNTKYVSILDASKVLVQKPSEGSMLEEHIGNIFHGFHPDQHSLPQHLNTLIETGKMYVWPRNCLDYVDGSDNMAENLVDCWFNQARWPAMTMQTENDADHSIRVDFPSSFYQVTQVTVKGTASNNVDPLIDAEIQLFGSGWEVIGTAKIYETTTICNVAQGKSVTASEQWITPTHEFVKENAVNGVLEEEHENMYHSITTTDPFLEVDLGGAYSIYEVGVYWRKERMEIVRGFIVELFLGGQSVFKHVAPTDVDPDVHSVIKLYGTVVADTARVTNPGQTTLELYEFQVFEMRPTDLSRGCPQGGEMNPDAIEVLYTATFPQSMDVISARIKKKNTKQLVVDKVDFTGFHQDHRNRFEERTAVVVCCSDRYRQGWEHIEDVDLPEASFYYHIPREMHWGDAYDYCEREGGSFCSPGKHKLTLAKEWEGSLPEVWDSSYSTKFTSLEDFSTTVEREYIEKWEMFVGEAVKCAYNAWENRLTLNYDGYFKSASLHFQKHSQKWYIQVGVDGLTAHSTFDENFGAWDISEFDSFGSPFKIRTGTGTEKGGCLSLTDDPWPSASPTSAPSYMPSLSSSPSSLPTLSPSSNPTELHQYCADTAGMVSIGEVYSPIRAFADGRKCLEPNNPVTGKAYMAVCDHTKIEQRWLHDSSKKTICADNGGSAFDPASDAAADGPINVCLDTSIGLEDAEQLAGGNLEVEYTLERRYIDGAERIRIKRGDNRCLRWDGEDVGFHDCEKGRDDVNEFFVSPQRYFDCDTIEDCEGDAYAKEHCCKCGGGEFDAPATATNRTNSGPSVIGAQTNSQPTDGSSAQTENRPDQDYRLEIEDCASSTSWKLVENDDGFFVVSTDGVEVMLTLGGPISSASDNLQDVQRHVFVKDYVVAADSFDEDAMFTSFPLDVRLKPSDDFEDNPFIFGKGGESVMTVDNEIDQTKIRFPIGISKSGEGRDSYGQLEGNRHIPYDFVLLQDLKNDFSQCIKSMGKSRDLDVQKILTVGNSGIWSNVDTAEALKAIGDADEFGDVDEKIINAMKEAFEVVESSQSAKFYYPKEWNEQYLVSLRMSQFLIKVRDLFVKEMEEDCVGVLFDPAEKAMGHVFGEKSSTGHVCGIQSALTRREDPKLFPGMCCLDAPFQLDGVSWGYKYDCSTRCQTVGTFFSSLNQEACHAHGGTYCPFADCKFLKQCIMEEMEENSKKHPAYVRYLERGPSITNPYDAEECGQAREYFGYQMNFINDMEICDEIEQMKYSRNFEFINEFFGAGSPANEDEKPPERGGQDLGGGPPLEMPPLQIGGNLNLKDLEIPHIEKIKLTDPEAGPDNKPEWEKYSKGPGMGERVHQLKATLDKMEIAHEISTYAFETGCKAIPKTLPFMNLPNPLYYACIAAEYITFVITKGGITILNINLLILEQELDIGQSTNSQQDYETYYRVQSIHGNMQALGQWLEEQAKSELNFVNEHNKNLNAAMTSHHEIITNALIEHQELQNDSLQGHHKTQIKLLQQHHDYIMDFITAEINFIKHSIQQSEAAILEAIENRGKNKKRGLATLPGMVEVDESDSKRETEPTATKEDLIETMQEMKREIASLKQDVTQELMATKEDLAGLKQEIKQDVMQEMATKEDLAGLKQEIKQDVMQEMATKEDLAGLKQEIIQEMASVMTQILVG